MWYSTDDEPWQSLPKIAPCAAPDLARITARKERSQAADDARQLPVKRDSGNATAPRGSRFVSRPALQGHGSLFNLTIHFMPKLVIAVEADLSAAAHESEVQGLRKRAKGERRALQIGQRSDCSPRVPRGKLPPLCANSQGPCACKGVLKLPEAILTQCMSNASLLGRVTCSAPGGWCVRTARSLPALWTGKGPENLTDLSDDMTGHRTPCPASTRDSCAALRSPRKCGNP